MNLLLGVVLAFIALVIGSPLAALLLGISFTLLIGSNEELILKPTGTKLLQIGIVILGLTISSSGAINLTTKYFPYISLFVIVIFLVGLIASKILKIDTKLSMLLVSGTAICGATAMVAISPLIKAKPKDLLTSLGVIFIFNAIAIAILPIIGNNIEEQTELTLRNCQKQLLSAGSSFKDVFKVNVYLKDIQHWERFNLVYVKYFTAPNPVRTAVETGLIKGLLVEIEMWATKNKS